MKIRPNLASTVSALVLALSLCGTARAENPKDPIEGFNRAIFSFNEGLDNVVLRPVAKGYDAVLPTPVKNGVLNFFGNIADVFIGVNNILQGKVSDGFSDFGRVAVNSTVGILGVIDFASDWGMDKHDEDFGQTFGRWGASPGTYVVLPLFGPRDVRDVFGLAVDMYADPVSNVGDVPARNSAVALRLISDRTALLPADKVIEEAALDKYSYLRDAYLQRRRNQVFDGRPPRSQNDDE